MYKYEITINNLKPGISFLDTDYIDGYGGGLYHLNNYSDST